MCVNMCIYVYIYIYTYIILYHIICIYTHITYNNNTNHDNNHHCYVYHMYVYSYMRLERGLLDARFKRNGRRSWESGSEEPIFGVDCQTVRLPLHRCIWRKTYRRVPTPLRIIVLYHIII